MQIQSKFRQLQQSPQVPGSSTTRPGNFTDWVNSGYAGGPQQQDTRQTSVLVIEQNISSTAPTVASSSQPTPYIPQRIRLNLPKTLPTVRSSAHELPNLRSQQQVPKDMVQSRPVTFHVAETFSPLHPTLHDSHSSPCQTHPRNNAPSTGDTRPRPSTPVGLTTASAHSEDDNQVFDKMDNCWVGVCTRCSNVTHILRHEKPQDPMREKCDSCKETSGIREFSQCHEEQCAELIEAIASLPSIWDT